jgi:ATP-dependent helicase Lhr and Lhr-like helicase
MTMHAASLLPEPFLRWFVGRGWTPRAHQSELLAKARERRSVLLIAPTGAGKTPAGVLPGLVELAAASVEKAASQSRLNTTAASQPVVSAIAAVANPYATPCSRAALETICSNPDL